VSVTYRTQCSGMRHCVIQYDSRGDSERLKAVASEVFSERGGRKNSARSRKKFCVAPLGNFAAGADFRVGLNCVLAMALDQIN